MSTSAVATGPDRLVAGSRPRTGSDWAIDVCVCLTFLALAVLVLDRYWAAPGLLQPAANSSDPPFFEWMLVHATRIFTAGENPFFTPQLNAPLGVNTMANTGLLGLTVPLVPVTLIFGAPAALVLMITLGLAGTASAWYLVLARHLVDSRLAAAIGGAFAGFAPGMINHTNAHPNLVAQFLLPFLAWRALTMRTVRHGLVLGLLITWQAFINEELLFLTALALGVFVAGYAACRPAQVRAAIRPFLTGLGVAVAVAAVLLGYPLWFQFFGPQHYHGLPAFVLGYGADLDSFPAFAKLSLIGQSAADHNLAPQPEENTFLGWPLLIAIAVIIGVLWRRALVRAVAGVGLVFAVLSLGQAAVYRGHTLFTATPWRALDALPLFDSVVPTRLALVLIPVLAVLLGLAVDAALPVRNGWLRAAALTGVGVALIPVLPRMLPVSPGPPVPVFISSGDWRRYLTGTQSLVSADATWTGNVTEMVWANAAGQGYRVVGGYFLGPDGSGNGQFGPVGRPTSGLLAGIGYDGGTPSVTDEQRAQAQADLRFWHAGAVLLGPGAPHADELHATLDQLLGAGSRVDDVWVWRVG